jgi:Rrf2 family protein
MVWILPVFQGVVNTFWRRLWCEIVVKLWRNDGFRDGCVHGVQDVHLSTTFIVGYLSTYSDGSSKADMLRLTKKADYGLMALKYLAEQTDGSAHSAKDIAEAYHIPPQLLAKILQTLAKAGILVSHAGTNGGYALSRPSIEITAFEVIRAIDGPLFITSCITIHGSCDLVGTCTIKEPLRKVNDSIKDLLSGIRIADLVEANDAEHVGTGAPVGGGLVSIAV